MKFFSKIFLICCFTLPSVASASVILDQSVIRDNFNSGGAGPLAIAQTVKVGISGHLDSINVFGFAAPNSEVVFRLHEVDINESPIFSSVLGTVLFNANSLTTSDTPHVLDLSNFALQYSVGDIFAFSIYVQEPDSRLNWYFNYDQAGYDRGKGFLTNSVDQNGVPIGFMDAANVLPQYNNLDWQFQTFMSSDPIVNANAPNTMLLCLASLLLMARIKTNIS